MKWSKIELFRQADQVIEFEQKLNLIPDIFDKIEHILELQDATLSGSLTYSSSQDRLFVKIVIKGNYLVPCAITLEPIQAPCKIEAQEIFALKQPDLDNQAIYVQQDHLDLTDWIVELVIIEAPLKVVKPGLKEYPKGKGWEVVKEKVGSEKQPDPRLAKFKEFKPE